MAEWHGVNPVRETTSAEMRLQASKVTEPAKKEIAAVGCEKCPSGPSIVSVTEGGYSCMSWVL